MSLDCNSLLENVKKAAVEAVKADKPFELAYGEVISVAPLLIMVDQKMNLSSSQIVLTSAVRDFTVAMTVQHTTEDAQGEADLTHKHACTDGTTEDGGSYNLAHRHDYKGTKTFQVHLGLKAGERVLLMRANGGQKYIVLDRLCGTI